MTLQISQDDLFIKEPETDIAIRSLVNYLKADAALSDKIDQFYCEWPDGNKGEYETELAVHTKSSTHTHVQPVKESVYDIIEDASQAGALYRTGKFDMQLQVDIWTPYKAKRNELYALFHDIINKDFSQIGGVATGLSLTLDGYYDVIARYDIVGYNFPDTERGSQEDEWRVRIDLAVHFDEKRFKLIPRMTDIQLDAEISETVIIEE